MLEVLIVAASITFYYIGKSQGKKEGQLEWKKVYSYVLSYLTIEERKELRGRLAKAVGKSFE